MTKTKQKYGQTCDNLEVLWKQRGEGVQPLRWWRILKFLECVRCELSIGSLTSRPPRGRSFKLIIIAFIISNAWPDARAGGGPTHPTGIWSTWLVRRRESVRRPKGRFFRSEDTICWLSVSLTLHHLATWRSLIRVTLDENILLQHCVWHPACSISLRC